MVTAYLTLEESYQVQRALRSWWPKRLTRLARSVALVGVTMAVVYLAVSGPAQLLRLDYWWSEWLGLNRAAPTVPSQPKPTVTDLVLTVPPLTASQLVIPKIGVTAPIDWEVPLAVSLNGLQRGVVHAAESVLPGLPGRTFIIGHSSGYWWNDNPWTKIFALLDQLEPGDQIYLERAGTIYIYAVNAYEIVSPREVQVIHAANLKNNQLALMTCTPVGTTLNRLIVYAEPVDQVPFSY